MFSVNDPNNVKVQYTTDKNLAARGALHQRFSVNKYGWANWVFDQYHFSPMVHVLEIGCGNGGIWKANKKRIPENIHILATDLSAGMLDAAKTNLLDVTQIEYAVMDVQNIPYPEDSFDIVIANHMLYHVPDRGKALTEVARVLKPDGTFYATTNGISNLKELKTLLQGFDSDIDYATYSVAQEFGLENGMEQLSTYFGDVELIRYEDALHITEAQPLVDYVLSFEGHSNVMDIIKGTRIDEFTAYVSDRIDKEGSITITKDAGMFISKQPKKHY